MEKHTKVKWVSEPDEKDYPAAASYLSLFIKKKTIKKISSQFDESTYNSIRSQGYI
jgi:hypothetical protein